MHLKLGLFAEKKAWNEELKIIETKMILMQFCGRSMNGPSVYI